MTLTVPPVAISCAGTAYLDLGGSGPALVLLHGVGLDHTMWAQQAAAFQGSWRVIAPDMLGHGDSPRPRADAQLDDYADQITALLSELGVTRAVLVGFSMGALVARAIALARPDWLIGLVLLNGVFDRGDDVRDAIAARVVEVEHGGPAANAQAALQRWFTPAYHRDHAAEIAQLNDRLGRNDPQGYLATYRLFASEDNFGADRLGTIAVPTLVATGEFDVGSTPEMAHALAARIPDARTEILPGARHMMPVEHAAQINDLLGRFLETPAIQRSSQP